MGLRRAISNFYNNFGEEPQYDEDYDEEDYEDEEDYDEEGAESDGEIEDEADDESNFGDDIGDGYGEDTVDPLDAQERAETKESNKAQTSPITVKKQSKSNKSSELQKLIKKIQGKRKNVILNRREVELVKKNLLPQKFKKKLGMHTSFKCAKCHSPSIYCSSSMLRMTSRIIMRGYGLYYSYYYCINPTCSWRMQRFPPYIQRANGNSYAGGVKCVIDWTSLLNDF